MDDIGSEIPRRSDVLRDVLVKNLLAGVFFFVPLIWVFPKIVGIPRKSSILTRFSIINHPIWGTTIFGNIHLLTMNFHTLIKIQVSMHFPAVGYGFGNACRYIHETLCDLHQMAKAFQGAYLDTSQGIGCQTKLAGSLDVLIYTHRMCIVQTFCHKSPHDCCHC